MSAYDSVLFYDSHDAYDSYGASGTGVYSGGYLLTERKHLPTLHIGERSNVLRLAVLASF